MATRIQYRANAGTFRQSTLADVGMGCCDRCGGIFTPDLSDLAQPIAPEVYRRRQQTCGKCLGLEGAGEPNLFPIAAPPVAAAPRNPFALRSPKRMQPISDIDFSKPSFLVYEAIPDQREKHVRYHGAIWAATQSEAQAIAESVHGPGAMARTETQWREIWGLPPVIEEDEGDWLEEMRQRRH